MRPGTESPPATLRVLLVSDSYPPLIGGATLWAQRVARYMAGRGHTVEVVTSWQPGTPAEESEPGVTVRRLRDLSSRVPWASEDPYKHHPPPFPDPEAVLRLRRTVKGFQPDLIHSYGWLTHSLTAALTGIRAVPLLMSAHDYGNVCALRTLVRRGEICDGPALAKCLQCAGSNYGSVKGAVAVAGIFGSRPLIRRKVTAIHSNSRYTAKTLDRGLGFPGIPITTVASTFDHDASEEPPDEAVLAELPDEPFIFFVGALRSVKGIGELFSAYDLLKDPPPLVLAGSLETDTPKQFPSGVTVISNVPHSTVMAMWDRALFGVFPSRWAEPLGNVVFEAMSRGRAVIGTRPGGHEDLIDDGVTGLLVPAGDVDALALAMSRLASDAELRKGFERRGHERARAFSPEVVLPELERLYFETIRASGVTRRR